MPFFNTACLFSTHFVVGACVPVHVFVGTRACGCAWHLFNFQSKQPLNTNYSFFNVRKKVGNIVTVQKPQVSAYLLF